MRPREEQKIWVRAVWFKHAVPKHAFNFWTANYNRLPIRSRLHSWGMNINPNCVFCDSSQETRDHLFLHCTFASSLWKTVLTHLGQPPATFISWEVLISWLLGRTMGLSSTLKKLVAQATIYLLWQERNSRTHDGPSASVPSVFKLLDRTIRDIILANSQRKRFRGFFSSWFKYHI